MAETGPQDGAGAPEPGGPGPEALQAAWSAPMPQAPTLPDPAEPAESGPVYLLASWGQRVGAYLIDLGILMIPLLGLYALLLPGLFDRAGDDERLQEEFDAMADPDSTDFEMTRFVYWILVVAVVTTVAYWLVIGLYNAVFMSRTAGQTPGKRLVGIRVMRVDGRPIGFWWALYRTLVIREALFGVGSFLSGGLLPIAQYLWPLWDPQRRALHDVVARSRVVMDAEGRA